MSARDKLIRRLSEDSLGGIATLHDVTDAEQLLDAYRAEVLGEVVDRLARRATLYGSSQTVNEVMRDLARLAGGAS